MNVACPTLILVMRTGNCHLSLFAAGKTVAESHTVGCSHGVVYTEKVCLQNK